MTDPGTPAFTVVAGNPDDAELAAVTAVLCAVLRRGDEELVPPAPPGWTRPERYVAPGSWCAGGRTL